MGREAGGGPQGGYTPQTQGWDGVGGMSTNAQALAQTDQGMSPQAQGVPMQGMPPQAQGNPQGVPMQGMPQQAQGMPQGVPQMPPQAQSEPTNYGPPQLPQQAQGIDWAQVLGQQGWGQRETPQTPTRPPSRNYGDSILPDQYAEGGANRNQFMDFKRDWKAQNGMEGKIGDEDRQMIKQRFLAQALRANGSG
jgi:hypothetical protein